MNQQPIVPLNQSTSKKHQCQTLDKNLMQFKLRYHGLEITLYQSMPLEQMNQVIEQVVNDVNQSQ